MTVLQKNLELDFRNPSSRYPVYTGNPEQLSVALMLSQQSSCFLRQMGNVSHLTVSTLLLINMHASLIDICLMF